MSRAANYSCTIQRPATAHINDMFYTTTWGNSKGFLTTEAGTTRQITEHNVAMVFERERGGN